MKTFPLPTLLELGNINNNKRRTALTGYSFFALNVIQNLNVYIAVTLEKQKKKKQIARNKKKNFMIINFICDVIHKMEWRYFIYRTIPYHTKVYPTYLLDIMGYNGIEINR